MKLSKPTADVFVPDGNDVAAALARTTHLGIGAHQDDLEFMAVHGILACFGQTDKSFTGVVCTDGAGSSRTGVYADYTDGQMKQVRMVSIHPAGRLVTCKLWRCSRIAPRGAAHCRTLGRR